MSKPLPPKRVLEICDQALELPTSERATFLNRQCGDDDELKTSVRSVLAAIGNAAGFLEVDSDLPHALRVGESFGPYAVMESLGEGGMGSVFLAERRTDDYKQKVAIKVVRAQMMGTELVRRFQAERQILAGLSHPYIAGLIDGGTTEQGAPYLVMEYIDGTPLNRYCDEQKLNVRQRLELIQKIAVAVQYAHQNLVVHRDLKPSNVLVTSDGIPKLLDFGIAKLIQADTDDQTVDAQRAMTPQYASPEQILEGKTTTASDVFALGVMTYELLTGRRPRDLDTTDYRKLIEQLDTTTLPKPSQRLLETDPETLQNAASVRQASPAKLQRSLRGDLDNILLMALRREPERRYASVAQFSEDIQRYLDGHPVIARADTWGYRASSFVRRNWLAVGSAALVALSLLAGVIGFAWQASIASTQREIAEQETDKAVEALDFFKTTLWSASPWEGEGDQATIEDVLRYAEENIEEHADRFETHAFLLGALGEVRVERGEYEQALPLAEEAIKVIEDNGGRDDPGFAAQYRALGLAQSYVDQFEPAKENLMHAKALYEANLDDRWKEYAATLNEIGTIVDTLGEPEGALDWYQRSLDAIEQDPSRDVEQYTATLSNFALSKAGLGDYEGALTLLERCVDVTRDNDMGDAKLGLILGNVAAMHSRLNQIEKAVEASREAVALQNSALGADHPSALMSSIGYGNILAKAGDYDTSVTVLETTWKTASESLPAGHQIVSYAENVYGTVLCDVERAKEGAVLLESSVSAREAVFPEGHWAIASSKNSLGHCYSVDGEFERAERLLLASHTELAEQLAEDHELVEQARTRLAALYDRWGRPEQAEPYR